MVIGEMAQEVDLAVIGGGPGGYTAALRAAELGVKTVLINDMPSLGGVCLHMGCIPSKALLHAAEIVENAAHAASFGLHFGSPKFDFEQLREWKVGIINKLSQGILAMCKNLNVDIISGKAVFVDSRNLRIESDNHESSSLIKFKHAILATGSRPTQLPGINITGPKILDSTSALQLTDIPQKLLIIGGGYIGLETGSIYAALGSEITVVEMTDSLLPGVDKDLVKPLATQLQQKFKSIYLNTKVTSLKEEKDSLVASFEGKDAPQSATFDKVLVAVGRKPNSDNIGLENTQVEIDSHGFINIDHQCRTNDKRIFAIGDVSGQPMLAHRAIRQGFVAAEVVAGKASSFDNLAIPAVVFTEPEIAWCGLTETEAKSNGNDISVAKFPWSSSGRAQTLASNIGQTKILFDPATARVLGIGIVGPRAGDLISEGVLAIEMGATLEDLMVSIHPHPTLSETIADAAFVGIKRMERQRSG